MTLAFWAVVPLVAAHLDKAVLSPEIWNASPKFDIQYVESLEPSGPVETVEMMLRGHRYNCQIPLNTVDQFDTLPMDEDKVITQAMNVLKEKDWCKFRLDSYWGYRYCAGDDLLQFVPEWHNKEAFTISNNHYNFTLGKATGIMTLGRKNGLTYIKTEFTNGTICDLTGEPRHADIIYYCDPNAKEINVKSINEIASCEYEAYIARPELCSMPEFVQKSHKNIIHCADLDREVEEVVFEDSYDAEKDQDQVYQSTKVQDAENSSAEGNEYDAEGMSYDEVQSGTSHFGDTKVGTISPENDNANYNGNSGIQEADRNDNDEVEEVVFELQAEENNEQSQDEICEADSSNTDNNAPVNVPRPNPQNQPRLQDQKAY